MNSVRASALRVLRGLDTGVWRLAERLDATPPANEDYVLLLPSTGGGNIGDQAMFESVVQNLPDRRIVALVHGASSYDLSFEPDCDRVRTVTIPNFLHGHSVGHLMSLLEVRRLSSRATSFVMIGADITDGAYSPTIAGRMWFLCREIARQGRPVRVLGFSWNSSPPRAILVAAKRAASAGAQLYPRDPHSWGRLNAEGVRNLTQAADTVFCHELGVGDVGEHPLKAITTWLQAPAPRAIVNVSGLVGRSVDQNPEYLTIFDALLRRGFSPLLVPHVTHEGGSDIDAIASLRDYLRESGHGDVDTVDELLSPTNVRRLAAQADVVITGRMHLSILGALEGATPIVMATQGKVSGLMEMLGLEQNCVTPSQGFGMVVARLIENLEPDAAATQIRGRLPAIQELARMNFA